MEQALRAEAVVYSRDRTRRIFVLAGERMEMRGAQQLRQNQDRCRKRRGATPGPLGSPEHATHLDFARPILPGARQSTRNSTSTVPVLRGVVKPTVAVADGLGLNDAGA